jgi:hypothetical protein
MEGDGGGRYAKGKAHATHDTSAGPSQQPGCVRERNSSLPFSPSGQFLYTGGRLSVHCRKSIYAVILARAENGGLRFR